MASGDVKMAVLGNIHMYIRVIEVSDFKSDFKFLLLSSLPCIVARSSKGPLPSGLNPVSAPRSSPSLLRVRNPNAGKTNKGRQDSRCTITTVLLATVHRYKSSAK